MDADRYQCLVQAVKVSFPGETAADVVERAQAFYDFVTGAKEQKAAPPSYVLP